MAEAQKKATVSLGALPHYQYKLNVIVKLPTIDASGSNNHRFMSECTWGAAKFRKGGQVIPFLGVFFKAVL